MTADVLATPPLFNQDPYSEANLINPYVQNPATAGGKNGACFLDLDGDGKADLAAGERQISRVGAAHQCRHLSPPGITEIADFFGAPQYIDEPRRCAGAQCRRTA